MFTIVKFSAWIVGFGIGYNVAVKGFALINRITTPTQEEIDSL